VPAIQRLRHIGEKSDNGSAREFLAENGPTSAVTAADVKKRLADIDTINSALGVLGAHEIFLRQ
jgi:hypothetical protein